MARHPNVPELPDIDVRHTNPAPVHVLGHPSSGTSVLTRLLRNYFRIAFGTESQFIVRYYDRLHRYGDLSDDSNLRRLIDDILQERWFDRCWIRFKFETTAETVFADLKERSYRGVLDATFGQLAKYLGMSRWGDKSPNDVYRLPVIRELFPEAKYLHIVRDGRDVALSLFARPFGRKNIYLAARDWRSLVGYVDEFAATLPTSQYCEIRYEDLLSCPVETFERLGKFLEIDDPDGRVMEFIAEHLPHDIKQANFNKWRKRWPRTTCLRYERIACDVLRYHGYDTILNATEKTATNPLATGMWHLHDKLAKYTFPAYWQDNFYKARLRLRDSLQACKSGIPGMRASGSSRRHLSRT